MIDPTSIETALTEAEDICHRRLTEILGLKSGVNSFIAMNGGVTDCAVFDIGYPQTGEVMAFPATKFHFRATVDLYSRSRKQIQQWMMRIIAAMPIAPTQSQSNDLETTTSVSHFRLAPETRAIEPIGTTELKSAANEKGVEVFTTTAIFDIVFTVGSRN